MNMGATPRFIAAQNGREKVVWETPLYIGAEFCHGAVVRALIVAGADITEATRRRIRVMERVARLF